MQILRVAVAAPLFSLFDYLPPEGIDDAEVAQWSPGCRLSVPFGRQKRVGILVQVSSDYAGDRSRLRRILSRIDTQPVLDASLLQLTRWAAHYYHHPPGDALMTALPVRLRQGEPAEAAPETRWALTDEGATVDPASIGRAVRQRRLLDALTTAGSPVAESHLREQADCDSSVLRRLQAKGWIQPCAADSDSHAAAAEPAKIETGGSSPPELLRNAAPTLNDEQRAAVDAIASADREFGVFLLHGITGSGKTEVYLAAAESVLRRGGQILVMVPEITLSPQIAERFAERFQRNMAVSHSGLSDRERLVAWRSARDGSSSVIIGTRSAVFAPMAQPGLIIVDEEHDAAYKQQDGFRYSARDLAVQRARHFGIPVILGSATPSLESWNNAQQKRYRLLTLATRAAEAKPPAIRILDVRSRPMKEGLSPQLLGAIGSHLEAGGQCLLYINRRGYSPALLCHECGWLADCRRCDAHMVLHQRRGLLRCHHCAAERPVDTHCPECSCDELVPVGQGTQRVEQALTEQFPDIGIARVDRDAMTRKGAWDACMDGIRDGKVRILVGTQMLTKGHDFPGITLVGILDGDQGLFGSDFRAGERMAQMVIQVSGRAGRGRQAGEVFIQTHHPEHPMIETLRVQDYERFAALALAERRDGQFPPFAHLALLRAEATDPQQPAVFLEQARQQAAQSAEGVDLWGPVTAPMPRRAGRHREQLLLQSASRKALHAVLDRLIPTLSALPGARKVRWSIDVDPQDML